MMQRRRTCSSLSSVLVAVMGLLIVGSTHGAADPVTWRYTMVAFSNASDVDLDVYESTDATGFAPVRLSAYHPPGGLVRDPSIFHHSDGWYYLTYTTGGTGATIGLARSRDRSNWEFMENFPVPLCCALLPGTGAGTGSASPPFAPGSAGSSDGPSLSPFTTKAWAPEWFVDGDRVNIVLSLSTGGGFVPYMMTALEPSLHLWSLPTPIAGLGADRIDTTIVKDGSTYHAFTKNETKKVIEHAVSQSPTGPYTFVPPGNWGDKREGPSLVQLPNGTWRMFFDAYTEGRYLYSDSSDGLRTWSSARELPGLSGSVRHFGVMREPA